MRERMERANRAAAWERRSGRRLHKSARRASFPAVSKPDRGQHLVAGSAEACAQAVQLLSGAPPCPYYGASDRTRCAPCAIARRWQAGRRRSGRGMDLQTAQPSLCAPPFPYCGAQGAMQALSRGKQSGASASPRDRRRLARRPCSCCPARHPCPYYGASDRTRCAPCAIARRWQAGRRRSGRGMDLQTAQPSLCAPPFPYCGAQGAMQALSRGKQSGASASPRDQRRSAAACAQAVQLLSGAPPRPYFSITVERTGRGGRTVRVRARLRKRP